MERKFNENLPLEWHRDNFEVDASLPEVPLGIALARFKTLLESIVHNLYHTGKLTEEQARYMIRDAAAKLDRKFDIHYRRPPQ